MEKIRGGREEGKAAEEIQREKETDRHERENDQEFIKIKMCS